MMTLLHSATPSANPGVVASLVERAVAEVGSGRPVLVADEDGGAGAFVFAAELATPSTMAFAIRHGSGFICVAMELSRCEGLGLAPMYETGRNRGASAFRITVDAVEGVSTGISARDRAVTTVLLASPTTTPSQLAIPGHVVPVAVPPGGVLARPGHAEAAVDLARLAGLRPAAALCEVVSTARPEHMAAGLELHHFAEDHGLVLISVEDVVRHRCRTERTLRRSKHLLPPRLGRLAAVGYEDAYDGTEHLALVQGVVGGGVDVPVYTHIGCTGERRREDDLELLLEHVARQGTGVVLHLRFPCEPSDGAQINSLADEILADLGASSWHFADLRENSSATD